MHQNPNEMVAVLPLLRQDDAFSKNELQLLDIIRSLQDELLKCHKDLEESQALVAECKEQLVGMHKMLLMALENDRGFFTALEAFMQKNEKRTSSAETPDQ